MRITQKEMPTAKKNQGGLQNGSPQPGLSDQE